CVRRGREVVLGHLEGSPGSGLWIPPGHRHFYNAAAEIAKGRQAFLSISCKNSTHAKQRRFLNAVAPYQLPRAMPTCQRRNDEIGIETAFPRPGPLADAMLLAKRGVNDELLHSRRTQTIRPLEPALRLGPAATAVLPAVASHDP